MTDRFIALDVGQGDAFYLEYDLAGTQSRELVDGGRVRHRRSGHKPPSMAQVCRA